MQPIIFHLDMNSYFASVEQQDNPQWRGQPLGVCEHLGGIIIAASREAKVWGIKTGTPVWEARKLYPKIILTPTRAERYRFYTRKFLKVVNDYTDKVEKYSIDECFFDATKQCNIRTSGERQAARGELATVDPWREAVSIAREIKSRFKKEVGDFLTCSIGIADNKLLAKVASDMKKPDGLVVIVENQRSKIKTQNLGVFSFAKNELYHQLKLIDIPGIGKRQQYHLNELGIRTLADLRDYPKSHLVARFGPVMGHHLYNMGQLRGSWKERVLQDQNIKSMGHMYTLPQDYRRQEFFLPVLYKLCEMVGRRLRRKRLEGEIVHFFTHDKNWQGFGRSLKLGYFAQDGREIFLEVVRSFAGQAPPAGAKIIGVTVAGLRSYTKQLSLFGDVERQRRVVAALDSINDRYGEFAIVRALQIPAGKVFRDSVGFGRVKEL
ncbi:MAG: DNA polymerase IV [Patescibacteria group bacterium]|nr:DNA polymerase IV [Patescibacteria group bacterium]